MDYRRIASYVGFHESTRLCATARVKPQVNESAPRARGDGPRGPAAPQGPKGLLPAPAGMVPGRPLRGHDRRSAPRARGDGPTSRADWAAIEDCSPRPRGWSPHTRRPRRPLRLLPAPAGMVPSPSSHPTAAAPAPRARGDGPGMKNTPQFTTGCSPRPRGWSQRLRGGHHPGDLLPAPAGMAPRPRTHPRRPVPAPRARGDGPPSTADAHTDDPCSPRPRGWSRGDASHARTRELLPVHAGMVPPAREPTAGRAATPRARGDDPMVWATAPPNGGCSPRPQGWSRVDLSGQADQLLLPVHAGMVPPTTAWTWPPPPAPRARGDGPIQSRHQRATAACSPCTRGWSHPVQAPARHRGLLPVHAGMVPTDTLICTANRSAPRARGDGPNLIVKGSVSCTCSPCTRGWSRCAVRPDQAVLLLPVHAGMVPRPAAPST